MLRVFQGRGNRRRRDPPGGGCGIPVKGTPSGGAGKAGTVMAESFLEMGSIHERRTTCTWGGVGVRWPLGGHHGSLLASGGNKGRSEEEVPAFRRICFAPGHKRHVNNLTESP